MKFHFCQNDRCEIHTVFEFYFTWLKTEVKFSTKVKSHNGLSSFRLSCERTLNFEKLVGYGCAGLWKFCRITAGAVGVLTLCMKIRLFKTFIWYTLKTLFCTKSSLVCESLSLRKIMWMVCFCWLWIFFKFVLIVLVHAKLT